MYCARLIYPIIAGVCWSHDNDDCMWLQQLYTTAGNGACVPVPWIVARLTLEDERTTQKVSNKCFIVVVVADIVDLIRGTNTFLHTQTHSHKHTQMCALCAWAYATTNHIQCVFCCLWCRSKVCNKLWKLNPKYATRSRLPLFGWVDSSNIRGLRLVDELCTVNTHANVLWVKIGDYNLPCKVCKG